MDPCNPNLNINNARSALRSNMGVPKAYAKNFSKKMICNAFKKCARTNVFPPMDMKIVDGYVYFVDSNSPLTARQYRLLFETGKKDDIVKIAKKLGVVELNKPIAELKAGILSILGNMDILEPIKAMKVEKKKEIQVTNGNLFNGGGNNTGNGNLFNGGGNNTGNGNLFNGGGNNKGRPVVRMNYNSNGAFNVRNGNRPGRPAVKAPAARGNYNSNGQFNSLRNFVKTPKVGSKTSSTNINKLMNDLENIKNQLGVLPENNRPRNRSVTRSRRGSPAFWSRSQSRFPSVTRTAAPSVTRPAAPSVTEANRYTQDNLNAMSVEGLRRVAINKFGMSSSNVRRPGYKRNRLTRNILNRQVSRLTAVRE